MRNRRSKRKYYQKLSSFHFYRFQFIFIQKFIQYTKNSYQSAKSLMIKYFT